MKKVLSIAGSDCSGGAVDFKTTIPFLLADRRIILSYKGREYEIGRGKGL